MKTTSIRKGILWIALFAVFSCQFSQQELPENSILYVDVSQHYPVKEIELSDIAEITYLTLEVDEDFLFKNLPVQITENYILIIDRNKGDVIFYDRKGIPVCKFNRTGNGPGEYSMIWQIVYDEKEDELFITTLSQQFQVYDRNGNFLRSLSIPNGKFYRALYNFNDSCLIAYDKGDNASSFSLIDKKTGELRKEIPFSYEKLLNIMATLQIEDGIIGVGNENFPILPHPEGILLNEYSTDTLFLFTPDEKLFPKVVRTPPSQKMEPLIYLNSLLEPPNYYFFSHVKVECDWKTDSSSGLPLTHIGMDKKSRQLFTQKIIWKDYKHRVFPLSPEVIQKTSDPGVGIIILPAEELIEAYENKHLSGELKKIASTLNIDDNYLIMFLRFK